MYFFRSFFNYKNRSIFHFKANSGLKQNSNIETQHYYSVYKYITTKINE